MMVISHAVEHEIELSNWEKDNLSFTCFSAILCEKFHILDLQDNVEMIINKLSVLFTTSLFHYNFLL